MAGPRKTTGSSKSTSTSKSSAASKSRSSTARKGAAKANAPAVKLVEPAANPGITVVSPPEPVVAEGVVKKVELIARVVEATGMKRKDVKPVVEATLAEVGKIIGEGSNMQLPELGKLMIHKRKDVPNGEMVMLKLRRKTAVKPLAEHDDNG